MKRHKSVHKMATRFAGGFAKYLVLIFIFAFLLFPVYWMLVTSLKTNGRNNYPLRATRR